MASKISPIVFICSFLVVLTTCWGHPGKNHGHGGTGSHEDHSGGESHENHRGSSCGDPCFKFSELTPFHPGERFYQGECTVPEYSPASNDVCTCFFDIGYHCYSKEISSAKTTTVTTAETTAAATKTAATTAETTAAATTTAATTAETTAAATNTAATTAETTAAATNTAATTAETTAAATNTAAATTTEEILMTT